MSAVKRGLLKVLTMPGVTAPFAPLRRGRAAIFMLHRFRSDDEGVAGHEPEALRRVLAYLRRQRYEILPLETLFRRLTEGGEPVTGAVAFTIDDGYFDHATVAAPLFAEFDAPVTTFVTTGFLDRDVWFWWNRIEWIFRQSPRREVVVDVGRATVRLTLADAAARAAAAAAFTLACKALREPEKLAAIEALALAAEVAVPLEAPREYAPMTWDQLRACERRGMSFGPHTVTHPILSRTSDEQARAEIAGSWARLREEAASPCPVFCYPNGGADDFSVREISIQRELGLLGAVVGDVGYAERAAVAADADARFRVRRFADAETLERVIQFVSGVERAKQLLLPRAYR